MKTMKKICRVLLAGVLVISMAIGLCGCGGEKSDTASLESANGAKKIRVGLSWFELQSSINQAWQDYFKQYGEEYGKEHNLEFEWIITVADGDPAKEMSNIQDLINQEVEVIVAWANNAETIGESIQAAQDAGIKFVTFDHKSSTIQPDVHVGEDSYQQAKSTCEKLAEILQENNVKGKCIEMLGSLTDTNAIERDKAYKDVEKSTGAWETVAEVPTEWEAEKFKSGLANALAAHPEANCIYVASDFAFNSVVTALDEAGRLYAAGEQGHIFIAADDVQPQGYQNMKKGYIDCGTTYDAWLQAVKVVEAVAKLATGEDVESEYLIQGRLATPDTVDSLDNLWSKDYTD